MKKIICFSVFVLLFQNSHILFSQTWTQKLPGQSVYSLAKDIQGNIYAGTLSSGNGLHRSTDSGENWTVLVGASGATMFSIAVDSAMNIYVANYSNGLLKSTNNGINFITIPVSTFNGKNTQAVACGKNGYIYVGCNNGGIFRSTDYGTTFPDTAISTAMIVCIFVDLQFSNYVYAGVSNATGIGNGFYRSTDYGLTFLLTDSSRNVYSITQSPATYVLFTVSTTSPYTVKKSTDRGATWIACADISGGAQRGITIGFLGNIYTSGNGGVWKSTDQGQTFTNAGLTYSATPILNYQRKIYAGCSGSSNGGVWIFHDSSISGVKQICSSIPDKFCLSQNYPNPFNPKTKIRFSITHELSPLEKGSWVKLIIYNTLGQEVTTLVNESLKPGIYETEFDGTKHPSGVYFYQLSTTEYRETKRMTLIK